MYLKFIRFFSLVVVLSFCLNCAASNKWKPVTGHIMTRWAEKVSPANAHPEYPRPQMVRDNWKNLNGLWDYAILPKDASAPEKFQGQILVPFAVESALSGVGKMVGANKTLWYRRTFKVPSGWKGQRLLLHFDAVDWESTLWVNGKEIGTHKGGYDPFSYDISGAAKDSGRNEIILRVWDPTNDNNAPQPRGKQVMRPGGIFYTAVTGIWQTAWLEPVPASYIKDLKIVPDIDKQTVSVTATTAGNRAASGIVAMLKDQQNGTIVADGKPGQVITITLKNPRLWSPDKPFLYDISVVLNDSNGRTIDSVKSYFGMRKISLEKDKKGINRLFLNNRPLFQFGPLDQGWWPDGLYTAPTDNALKYDVEVLKSLGFNMLRKHVKAEPRRFYYWCDKLGFMVWQDMPSSLWNRSKADPQKLVEIDKHWLNEWKNIIDNLHNHPCIVMWIPFNEGWGQHDTAKIANWTKKYDQSRLVDNASGWTDHGAGDVHDIHSYPGPAMPAIEENRAAVLGEFGGLGLPVKNHTWKKTGNWGYRSYKGREQLAKDYAILIQKLYPLIDKGLAAAVYTQTTDCEVEVNGLMTYDRKVIKLDVKEASLLNRGYLPPSFKRKSAQFIDKTSVELEAPGSKTEIRYTLDGSTPDKNSSLYTGPIKVNRNLVVKARCFWPDGTKSLVVEKRLKKAMPLSPVSVDIKQPGLEFKYYEGHWEQLPDFSTMTPAGKGTTKTINLSCVKDNSNYGLAFSGYVKIPRTEVYSFFTKSDDGTKLFIDGKKLITNDGIHGMREASGEIALKTGWHKIKVVYFQGEGGQGLEVLYEAQGIRKQRIPTEVLGH